MPTDQEVARRMLRQYGAELSAALHAVDEAKSHLRTTVRLGVAVGLSQVEVAQLAGVSRPTVREWLDKT